MMDKIINNKLKKYKVKDLMNPKKRKEILKIYPNLFDELKSLGDSLQKHRIEKNIQPFKTNYILEEIKNSQLPKWANMLMVILTALIFILSIALLLR